MRLPDAGLGSFDIVKDRMSSRKINASGTKVSREDMFLVDPREIVIDFESNGRWKPLDHGKVVEYARSFLAHGQQSPCLCRQIEDRRLQMSAGFHRLAAGLLICKGSPEDGIPKTPDFRIAVRVKPMNADEGFIANVVENKKRNQTSAVDDAHNLRRLKHMGKDDAEIAILFECKMQWLGKLELLLNLPDDIKEAVHDRRIPVNRAIELSEMSEVDRREVLAQAVERDDDGLHFDADAIAEKVNSHALTPGDKVNGKKLAQATRAKKEAKGHRVSRTVSEIRSFLKGAEPERENAQKIIAAFRDFLDGKRQGPWMIEQIERYVK